MPRCNMSETLEAIYDACFKHFGPLKWWPADTPFEVCVGAVLTQNTSWKNVVKAINNLKELSMLNADSIHNTEEANLALIIKPSGYFNIKAKRLKKFVSHLVNEHRGDLNSLFSSSVEDLRRELLSIYGVGKETADSIILYASEMPIFVVDSYTKRILVRHGLVHEDAEYDEIRSVFERNLPQDVVLFKEYHAQLVAVGNRYCRKIPRCGECPLGSLEMLSKTG
jgi:endonuclease III related protein